MKPGVAGHYFPGVSCCRVAVKDALYIFTNADELLLKIAKNNLTILYEIELNVIPGKLTDIQHATIQN